MSVFRRSDNEPCRQSEQSPGDLSVTVSPELYRLRRQPLHGAAQWALENDSWHVSGILHTKTRTSALIIGKERHARHPGKFEAALNKRDCQCFMPQSAGSMTQQEDTYRELIHNLSYCLGAMAFRDRLCLQPSPRLRNSHEQKRCLSLTMLKLPEPEHLAKCRASLT